MTKQQRNFGLVALALGGGYLVWRLNESRGGAVTFVSPFEFFSSGPPSELGSEGTGDTNPISMLFSRLATAFKAPGNAPAVTATDPAPGTGVDPVGPPVAVTKTAQPNVWRLPDNVDYLPNLGDPNFVGWSFAVTPPDLAWNLRREGM